MVDMIHLEIRNHERESFIDNLLVRIHFIVVMIRWTGVAPWESRPYTVGYIGVCDQEEGVIE